MARHGSRPLNFGAAQRSGRVLGRECPLGCGGLERAADGAKRISAKRFGALAG